MLTRGNSLSVAIWQLLNHLIFSNFVSVVAEISFSTEELLVCCFSLREKLLQNTLLCYFNR
jgi:hypothetical protein